MLSRRCHLHGLFAVLLALMTQLAAGASVPRLDLTGQVADATTLCHGADDAGGAPAKAPAHPIDCLACSLCIAAHPQVPLVPGLPKLTGAALVDSGGRP